MIKKIITLLLLCIFTVGLSYGVSRDYDSELQRENEEFYQSIQSMSKREKREAIISKQAEYQDRIFDKQRELLKLDRQKGTINAQERKETKQNLKKEIESLHRAQKNLR